jgi:hypothetical protein
MEKKIGNLICGFLLGCLPITIGFAQNQKLAQSGFKFLSVVSDARAAAMGEAMTSLQVGSSALFFNPSGMSNMPVMMDVTASTNQWIADIKHQTLSLAVKPFRGDYGVVGFSVQSVDYGDFYGTVVDRSVPQGYHDTEIFGLKALALGVGYAKQISDQFSVGGQVRWVHQDLGQSGVPVFGQKQMADSLGNLVVDSLGHPVMVPDTSKVSVSNNLRPFVFDFGVQFRTGIKSLVFGMSVRNFSKEVKYAEEGFQAPLVFNLGISMNLMDLVGDLPFDQSLYLSFDASHYRDHPEQLKVGLDYKLMNMLSLRGGYVSKSSYDESGFSFGAGVSKFGFAFDYAYTPFGVFDKVQRFTARFSL